MKTDRELGLNIHNHLTGLGIESAGVRTHKFDNLIETVALEALERHLRNALTVVCDLDDPSMADTPKRIAAMWYSELFCGLDYNNFPKCTVFPNDGSYNQMVHNSGVHVKSVCAHHLQNIEGTATLAYMPGKNIIGLSKFNRVVDFFSRRPQTQEQLTEQIGAALQFMTKTEDVAVVIKAKHGCVSHRGVGQDGCLTTTSFMGGEFRNNPSMKSEFLSL